MKRPNVLIFCTDQQRANHIGCAERSPLQTPNIDALAERGTRIAGAGSGVMLFDRQDDPYEMNNLADDPDYQNVVGEMLNEMVQQINRTEPRLPRRFSLA